MPSLICFSLDSQTLPVISSLDTVTITPPYVHFKRQFPEFILYYIFSGELFLIEDGQPYHLEKNHFILLDPSRVHWGEKASTCHFFYCHFSLGGLAELPVPTKNVTSSIYLPKHHALSTPRHISQVHSLVSRVLETFSGHGLYHKPECACLFYELLLTLSKDFSHERLCDTYLTTSSINDTLLHLLDFLHQSYALDISSTLIESNYHCNFDYLNRQFKKVTGQTIFVYLNNLRIEKARQLLSTGFYTIADIAHRTGFHDIYYFSKVFKKFTGTSPSQFRKSL